MMDQPAPFCQTHNSMLTCLETVINDVHLDLTNIDEEVNKCLPTTHQLPGNTVTPPFFKEPVNSAPVLASLVAELTKTHPLTIHNTTCGTSCIPRLPSMLLFIEKEVDRHVQYVDYINDKMNALPMPSHTSAVPMATSRSRLMSTPSASRCKIRTNPSLPVLRRSPTMNNLSIDSCNITSVSQQCNSSISSADSAHDTSYHSGPSCLCCSKCFEVLEWFSELITSKIQYIKDQCHDLQNRLSAELKEKEKELMVQLAQNRKAKQSVTNNFTRLEGLGLQALSICSNILMFEPVYCDQSTNYYGYQTNTRYAGDGQSCDGSTQLDNSISSTQPDYSTSCSHSRPDTTSLSSSCTHSMPPTPGHSISSTQSLTVPECTISSSTDTVSPTQSLPSPSTDSFPATQLNSTTTHSSSVSSSAGAYSIATSSDPTVPPAPHVSSCTESMQSQDNLYDEPVSCVKEASPDYVTCSPTPTRRPYSSVPESPMPELIEFQRRRSNSVNQYDNTFRRDQFRQRSHTISHAAPATRHVPNQYATIDETPENNILLHVNSDISVTFDDMKPKKMKKSKSSIMGQATKLKKFITKKFKRKSWDGPGVRKSQSPTSVQASSAGVQFFEYDFSDDETDDGLVNSRSNSLSDLSHLTGAVDTLTSHTKVQMSAIPVAEMTFTSIGSHIDTSVTNQVNAIEQLLDDVSTSATSPIDSRPNHPITSTACKPVKPETTAKSCFTSHTNGRIQLYIPSMPLAKTDDHFEDLMPARSSFDSSGIDQTVLNQRDQQDTEVDVSSQPQDPNPATSRKRLSFDATTNASEVSQSIYSFHEESSFDIQQGYASFRKIQKIASTPCQQPSFSHSTARKSIPFVNMPGRRTVVSGSLPLQEPELLTHLCQGQTSTESRRNIEKLCHLKPYLLQGKLVLSKLLYLINNYPHNMTEIPGFNYVTKQISRELVFHVSTQTYKPYIYARNLVWRLFTLAELFGGRTEALNTDIILAVQQATAYNFQITDVYWQMTCVPFIHKSINYLFRRKLKHPVFRSLIQQSDC